MKRYNGNVRKNYASWSANAGHFVFKAEEYQKYYQLDIKCGSP